VYDPQVPGFEFVAAVGKARRRDLLQEAERDRLARQISAGRPSALSQTLARVGGWMIWMGSRLQGSYGAPIGR
jgi:hypothetical protein